MLVYPADRIAEIQDSGKLGIHAQVTKIDFVSIMNRMRSKVESGRVHMEQGVSRTRELGYFEGTARFLNENTLEIDGKKIKSKRIFLAAGARPLVPPIKGIEDVPYITNETVLQLNTLPKSMIIVGGGDIAVEYAHFFSAMGTRVSLIQRNERLVPEEEPEISSLLKSKFLERMEVITGYEVNEASHDGSLISVSCSNNKSGEQLSRSAEKLLLASGRVSNADLLEVQNAGIKTDGRGFIEVNDFYQTSNKFVWAFGDILGRYMYRHVANRQALLVWQNAMQDAEMKLDSSTIPYAVFTSPQIATVGLKERQALQEIDTRDVLVGRASYADIAMGDAMVENDGFAKAVVDGSSGRILGFHIIGPQASILIQEVITIMALGVGINALGRGMHIHPALPELIISTFNNLRPINR